MEELKEINMLNDALFKALFRSIEARELISTILNILTGIPKEDLINAEYQGGEIPKSNLKQKGKTSDILIKVDNNKRIILECNQYYTDYIIEKNIDYIFADIVVHTKVGSNIYPMVTLINFDNYNHYNTDKGVLNFKIQDEDGIIETEQYNSIHLILANLRNKSYTENEELKKLANFLSETNIEDMKQDYDGDEKFMSCIKKIEELSKDPDFINYYDIDERHKEELKAMKETGFDAGFSDGEKVGVTKGKKETQIEVVKSMYKDGIEIDKIIKYVSLPLEAIKEILELS